MTYKEDYDKTKGQNIAVKETPEMKISKELQPIVSKKQYEKDSKDLHPKTQMAPGTCLHRT